MISVHLHKPHKNTTVSFTGEILIDTPSYRLIRAPWGRARLDLGYVTFEEDDVFFEHYYTERWFAIFELRTADGLLKGWYGNISRPARFTADAIYSDDLDLDLFVPPDRRTPLRLDVEEFEGRGVAESDPAAYAAAYAALDELEQMARAGAAPFDAPLTMTR
jgi:protein associated with RNAse G/E